MDFPKNTVCIWYASLKEASLQKDHVWPLLAADEKAKADRFRFEQHRHRYIVARGFLRCLAAQLLNQSPAALQFGYTDYGKPFLKDYPHLQFNLSHSCDRAIYAFALEMAVGVDIEYQDPQCDVENIAQRFFTIQEYTALQKLKGSEKLTAFFKLWVRKEAILKALGYGLSCSLSKVEFNLEQRPFHLIASHPNIQPREWSLHDLDPAQNFVAALAVQAGQKQMQMQVQQATVMNLHGDAADACSA